MRAMELKTEEDRTPLLVLDLDGTVREGKDDQLGRFVNGPEDVRVFPQAVSLMRRWKERGGRIIAVSNQGGVALGHLTLQKCGDAMIETVKQCDNLFDRVAFCIHHPESKDPEMARCWCRKPSPGLLIESALELGQKHGEFYPPYLGLFVGDRSEDEQCAKLAGFPFMWAADWRDQAWPT